MASQRSGVRTPSAPLRRVPRLLKQLIGPLAVLALVVGGLGVASWAPWRSDTHERELAWLGTLAEWVEEAPTVASADCAARFDERVGPAPSERLRPVARTARDGCRPSASTEHWRDVEWHLRSSLISTRFAAAGTTEEPALALAVRVVADQAVRVYCWSAHGWQLIAEEWGILDRDDFWGLYAFPDPLRGAIHLSSDVCVPLRFFTGFYTPYHNQESLNLAEALVMLGHDAEHVRDPHESEIVVECYAMQGVRGFVRDAGRSSGYANELARLAWDVAYPPDAAPFRTRDCRDGGRLDRHLRSSLWP
jgi:hypothetical protein